MGANSVDSWSPRKIILASLGVALFSSALTGGIVVWLLSGQKAAEPAVFGNAAPMAQATAAPEIPGDPLLAGNWYYDRQQWEKAVEAYQKVLAVDFNNPDVHTDLGNCYRFSKRPEMALVEYQLAQKQDPQHEHSLFNQASLYAENLKNPGKADEVAHQFLERFPNSPNVEALRKYLIAH